MFRLENTFLKIKPTEEKELTIRRIPRVNLAKFSERYELVIEKLLEVNGAMGSFLADNKNYTNLKELCKLIPIDEEPKTLQLEEIEENYALLTLLFFTTSFDYEEFKFDNLENDEGFKPSLISKFNFVEYEELVGKMAIKVRIGKMKEQMEAQQKMNAILETVKG
jgi:hypothetical protein